MSFIHDAIKIQYTNLGYLPGYPYHLISDKEMFEAFLKSDEGFFDSNYPCTGFSDELIVAYEDLKSDIRSRIDNYLNDPYENVIPDWIYSYMIGSTIGPYSSESDIDYLYDLFEMTSNNAFLEFTPEIAANCYRESQEWLNRIPVNNINEKRKPTMFGEPHVIKSLRLKQSNVLIDEVIH